MTAVLVKAQSIDMWGNPVSRERKQKYPDGTVFRVKEGLYDVAEIDYKQPEDGGRPKLEPTPGFIAFREHWEGREGILVPREEARSLFGRYHLSRVGGVHEGGAVTLGSTSFEYGWAGVLVDDQGNYGIFKWEELEKVGD